MRPSGAVELLDNSIQPDHYEHGQPTGGSGITGFR